MYALFCVNLYQNIIWQLILRHMIRRFISFIFLLCLSTTMFADTYSSLWKQVSKAEKHDLPRDGIVVLDKIVNMAEGEKAYGELIKAELKRWKLQVNISPDSLQPAISHLENRENDARRNKKDVLRAVYDNVLGMVYAANDKEGYKQKSREYFDASLQNPELLAAETAENYEPLITTGADSKIFYGDLLHVLGIQAERYDVLDHYYSTHGNRAAACISAYLKFAQNNENDIPELKKSRALLRIDSLLQQYGDLREAGELAIARYNLMANASDFTAKERYDYINYALNRWGSWPRMNVLRNALAQITLPSVTAYIKNYLLTTKQSIKVQLTQITNVNSVTVKLFRLNTTKFEDIDINDKQQYERYSKQIPSTPLAVESRQYVGQPPYRVLSDSVEFSPQAPGEYMVEITTDNNDIQPNRQLIAVSDLRLLMQSLPNNKARMVVVNAISGKPVPHARIEQTIKDYSNDGNKEDIKQAATYQTDEKGEYTWIQPKLSSSDVMLRPYTTDDNYGPATSCSNNYWYYGDKKESERCELYTDRSIYRPGEQVQVAALVWNTDTAETMHTVKDKNIKFTLRNAQGKSIAEQSAVTDAYGMASAHFTLPSTTLNGTFRISTNNNAGTSFMVTEYKRPTFQVKIDSVRTAYTNGDTIKLTGNVRTYSDMPVAGARVAVKANTHRIWWWISNTVNGTAEFTDTVTTDDAGCFSVNVPMQLPSDAARAKYAYYTVDVTATATNKAGESQQGSLSLPLSNRTAYFTCSLPSAIERDSIKTFQFDYKNIAGKPIPGSVTYTINKKQAVVNANTAVTGDGNLLESLPSGRYLMQAVCGTDTLNKWITLFSMQDKHVAPGTDEWTYQSAKTFNTNGKPVYIQVGSDESDLYLVYSICSGNTVIEKGTAHADNGLLTRQFTYKPAYGDGIILRYQWVKNGDYHDASLSITKPQPIKKLQLKWSTFRDKLTPGQKEEWTLHVADAKGKAHVAQLLISMYDKSLDAITPHKYNLSTFLFRRMPYCHALIVPYSNDLVFSLEKSTRFLPETDLNFSHIDTDILPVGRPLLIGRIAGLTRIRGTRSVMMAAAVMPEDEMKAKQSNIVLREVEVNAISGDNSVSSDVVPNISTRENLAATAFFYPALIANHQGDVQIKFTLPEALTTWHLMGIAHDTLMNHAQIEADVVASKDFMITPNNPRFIRKGDAANMAATLMNNSSKLQHGNVYLELTDAKTGKEVYRAQKPFSLQPNQSNAVNFDVATTKLSTSDGMLVCKWIATSTGYSDAEQSYLPLLSNKEQVTNTLPFTLTESGSKSISLSKLVPDNTNARVTVEYTSQPLWLAIQALPTVAITASNNAISQATAYYANSLSNYIMHSNPGIKPTLELWQQEKSNTSTLMSNLQNNSELKLIDLDETPWVTAAEQETNSKQQLINYFDENLTSYRLSDNLSKLQNLQHANGAFAWFPGMDGSVYITSIVVKLLTRLNSMVGTQTETASLLSKAFTYLDTQIAKEVTMLKQQEKKGTKNPVPSDWACDYLYSSALAHRSITTDMRYLLNLLTRQPAALTIYGKAGSAVILEQYGYTSQAKMQLKSLEQYLVSTADKGSYFDTSKAPYSWFSYQIPTQTAAIEAIACLQPADSVLLNSMQQWLLQAKHTQYWSSPACAADAVWALMLNGGKQQLTSAPGQTADELLLDGKPLPVSATSGLGYIKYVTDAQPRQLTVNKKSNHVSWGAVYSQYAQDTQQVDSRSNGLKVSRTIVGNQGVGDKVTVKLTITADRDYDFVQVVDNRAACLEPVNQVSGYNGEAYVDMKDNVTRYFISKLTKGTHVLTTDYYITRQGNYNTGTCSVQCAYSAEFAGRDAARSINVK